MAIALTGAGSLFVRLGHVYGPAADLLSLMGGTATTNVASGARFPARFTTLNTDLTNGTGLPKLLARSTDAPYAALLNWQNSQNLFTWVSQVTKDILGAMYNLDQSLPEDATFDNTKALKYLLSQMVGSTLSSPSSTIQQCTLSIGAQTNVNTPIGNPIIILGTKDVQGRTLQLVFPETITFTTTRDSQSGATAGNEQISYAGQAAASSVFSQFYPGGSGSSGSLSCVDGSKSNSTGNVLQNSDFLTTTTANQPDNWNYPGPGVIAVDLFTDTGNAYTTSGGSLKMLGTGGALLDTVTQSFNTTPTTTQNAGGTSYALLPDTQYAFNCWVKCSSTPGAGVLEFSLIDGGGSTLNDDFAVANLFTKSLTAVSTSFVNVNGTFRTPANLTTQTTPFKLKVRLSTAIDSGKSVFIGRMSMSVMTALYAGGPFCSICSGNTRTINGLIPDSWTVAITNTYGQFQFWLDKVFGLRTLGLQFPYSGAPTAADTLIA